MQPQKRQPVSFLQLDVFTHRPFAGNQLAVFPDADGLSSVEMASIAREMNYSESTFVVAASDPTALCRVRIFSPGAELPFAGHPTIGTAIALAYEGRIPSRGDAPAPVTLELGIGPVEVEVRTAQDDATPFAWMQQPVATFSPWHGDRHRLALALGLDPDDLEPAGMPIEVGSAGVPSIYVPLRSHEALRRAEAGHPDLTAIAQEAECIGAYCFHHDAAGTRAQVWARYFAPVVHVSEDPATGSAAGPSSTYLVTHGVVNPGDDGWARIEMEQGVEMGRPSQMSVEVLRKDGTVTYVRVGGHAVLVARGEVYMNDA
jgi:trans-2,3-dihydro-3-hydroxyanthranilate isomerase